MRWVAHTSRKPIELLVENGDLPHDQRAVLRPAARPHITRLAGEKDGLAEVLKPRTH